MREQIEDAEELIKDLYAIVSLQEEELLELRAHNRVLIAQVKALMKGQKVDYEAA